MLKYFISLIPTIILAWDWIYSPKQGGIWTSIQGKDIVVYTPDLGIKELYKTLTDKPYCFEYKFFEKNYKLIWDYPIKIAIFQCSPNTFITLDEEIGNISYFYREKVLKAPKSESIKFKAEKEIIYGKWKGDSYFVPTYTYLIK